MFFVLRGGIFAWSVDTDWGFAINIHEKFHASKFEASWTPIWVIKVFVQKKKSIKASQTQTQNTFPSRHISRSPERMTRDKIMHHHLGPTYCEGKQRKEK